MLKLRWSVVMAAAILAYLPMPVAAQRTGFRLEGRASRLFIGGGTHSAALSAATGFGARLEYVPPLFRGYASARLDYVVFPDAPGKHPNIQSAGVDLVLFPFGARRAGQLLEPYGSIGFGFIRYRPQVGEFPICDPLAGCTPEGAPQFISESNGALRPEIGAAIWPTDHVGLRAGMRLHVRVHSQWNGTGEQGELAAGVLCRW